MFFYTEQEIDHARRGGGFRWYAADRNGQVATLCDFDDENRSASQPLGVITHDCLNLVSGYFWRLVNPRAGLFWYERQGNVYRQVFRPEGVALHADRLPETVRDVLAPLVLPISFPETREFSDDIVDQTFDAAAFSTTSQENNNRRWRAFCDEFQLKMKPDDGDYWLFENEKAPYPGGLVIGGFCPECWEKRKDFSSLRYQNESVGDMFTEVAQCPVCHGKRKTAGPGVFRTEK